MACRAGISAGGAHASRRRCRTGCATGGWARSRPGVPRRANWRGCSGWIGALGHDLDLVATLDDARGHIYSALLVEQKGTMPTFLGLAETTAAHGLFGSLYTAARLVGGE